MILCVDLIVKIESGMNLLMKDLTTLNAVCKLKKDESPL